MPPITLNKITMTKIADRLSKNQSTKFLLAKMMATVESHLAAFPLEIQEHLRYILTKCVDLDSFRERPVDLGHYEYQNPEKEKGWHPYKTKEFHAKGPGFKLMFCNFPEALKSFDELNDKGVAFYKAQQFQSLDEQELYARGDDLLLELLTRFKEVRVEGGALAAVPAWPIEHGKEEEDGITISVDRLKQEQNSSYSMFTEQKSGVAYPIVNIIAATTNSIITFTFSNEKATLKAMEDKQRYETAYLQRRNKGLC